MKYYKYKERSLRPRGIYQPHLNARPLHRHGLTSTDNTKRLFKRSNRFRCFQQSGKNAASATAHHWTNSKSCPPSLVHLEEFYGHRQYPTTGSFVILDASSQQKILKSSLAPFRPSAGGPLAPFYLVERFSRFIDSQLTVR